MSAVPACVGHRGCCRPQGSCSMGIPWILQNLGPKRRHLAVCNYCPQFVREDAKGRPGEILRQRVLEYGVRARRLKVGGSKTITRGSIFRLLFGAEY